MQAEASIDALTQAFNALRAALDSNDATRILEASRIVADATVLVREHGAWRVDARLRERLDALLPLVEAARVHVNMAQDDLRRRLTLLVDHGAAQARVTYGR